MPTKVQTALASLLLALSVAPSQAAQQAARNASRTIPRTIIALYDSEYQADLQSNRIHYMAEMPLNHLGLILEYHDVNQPLPPVDRPDVRGFISWFESDSMRYPERYLAWAEQMVDAGRKYVLFGELSVAKDSRGRLIPREKIERLWRKLGLQAVADWTNVTYNAKFVYKDLAMVEFERKYPKLLPPFESLQSIDPLATSYLKVRRSSGDRNVADLVVTGPRGGYIANGYTHFGNEVLHQLQWYINPFEFFRNAFATDDLPKPDTTTLAGRRIYYSHIDGDGWRNRTEVMPYRQQRLSSAEVVLKLAIEPFGDLPVTVAPIAGDLDPDWYGGRETAQLARQVFALPWVEAGSHTYSHPLDWEYFATHKPAKGKPYSDWPERMERFAKAIGGGELADRWFNPPATDGGVSRGHDKPRSYTLYPFSMDQEIGGSAAYIQRFLPPGKKVTVVQWSGSTVATEEAVAATRAAGVRNINGGDTRFDPEYPSYAWVAPLSRRAGSQRQIYCSNSNENTYTNLWRERYFGFRYLSLTVKNTEAPIRLKPFNLYYHMYSGEKLASINALVENLTFARTLKLAPITTSHYAGIGDGFFSAKLVQLPDGGWAIRDRDLLDTIRFDRNTGGVDLARSRGVLGYNTHLGSLYVALDPAESEPVIRLAPRNATSASEPYLVESRWPVSNLTRKLGSFRFSASGYGKGEMVWKASPATRYRVTIRNSGGRLDSREILSAKNGLLLIDTDRSGLTGPLTFEVSR